MLIILGLCSALLFEWGIWHRCRIGLDKGERGFGSWSVDPTVLLLEDPLFGKRFHCIWLFQFVWFIISPNSASVKLFAYIKDYAICLLVGVKVQPTAFPL